MPSQRKSNQPNIRKILNDSKNPSGKTKKNINQLELGDYYRGIVKILRKVKPGPLILNVFDGSGTIDAIGRDSLFNTPNPSQGGSLTYNFGNIQIKDSRKKHSQSAKTVEEAPLTEEDIQVDGIFEISGKVNSHQNKLEIILDSISKALMDFDALIKTKSEPLRDTFSIESDRYESMKSRFLAIAQRIRFAIIDQQPILIRHHNDADGICAGLVIEQTIRNVMERREINPKNLIYRSPSISPFYDQIDLFRDISKFKQYSDTFGDKSPLVLLLDTGSTPENLFALQVLQTFHFECIIVDHHNPGEVVDGKSQVCDLLQFHLNPYLFGWDSQTCGGMLCYELARFIDDEFEAPLYPAVAAVADRCDIPEVTKLIENTGKNYDELMEMARVLDYLAYNFKFDSGDGVYPDVFTNPNLVSLIGSKVEELFQNKKDSIFPHLQTEQINSIWVTSLDLDQHSQRGKYPTPGKILGMVHDHIASTHEPDPVFTFGYFTDGVVIRATHPVLPVPTLLEKLQQDFPHANVDGGGHEQAGSLKFVPKYCEEILTYIKDQLKLVEIN